MAVAITEALAIPNLQWPFEDELRWLAQAAQWRHKIVEVGSYLGRSTVALARNTQGRVYAIDDWYGPRDDSSVHDEDRPGLYDQFTKNIEGLPVTPIRCDHGDTSALPPEWLRGSDDQRPDMVFIDGAHDYESVKRDILIWKARLRSEGLLCGHDRNESGVRRAIDELCPGWQCAPGNSMIWHWTEDAAMTTGIRKMDIDELKLLGTPNEFPRTTLAVEAPTEWPACGQAIKSRIGLAVMIPSTTRNADGTMRYSPLEWGVGLALLAPLDNVRHAILTMKDMQRDKARIALVKQAMSYGARYGFFLDDDVVPPPEVLQHLQYVLENADDDVAVCAGIYTSKGYPAVPLVFQDYGLGPFWKWRRGEVFECQAIATGCMMIDLHKVAMIPEPWFVDVHGVAHAKSLGLYKEEGIAPLSTEWTDDMFFCHKVRERGYRIMAHGGVLCEHYGQDGHCYTLAPDSYPMRMAAK